MKRLLRALMCAVFSAATLAAQERTPTDRSLSSSLLAVSFPAPVASMWNAADSAKGADQARLDVAYGRALRAGVGGLRQTLVLAVRSEELTMQTTGPTAGVLGARVGVRADERSSSTPVTSAEVYFGGRTMRQRSAGVGTEAGIDVLFGWGGFGTDTRASFGLRAPMELVAQDGDARFTVFAVPAMAWGHLRLRGCEDNGPGDNCGDLGVQLAFGRTRFVAAGGAILTHLPARLSIAGGIQRLFARGETERAWLGGSWTL